MPDIEPTVIKPKSHLASLRLIGLLAIASLIIFVGGFFIGRSVAIKTLDSLPLSVPLIQNPVIYEWQGSVEGTLTEKNDKSFTLDKNGTKLTISIKKDYTVFYPQGATGSARLKISDVAVGSFIRGNIWLPQKGKLGLTGVKDDIVGGTFSFSTSQKK